MSSFVGQGPLFIICLVLVLGLVVVIHELGHYLAGRAFGAAAESFSVGFGKPIFERKDKRNTRWRINWLPFGGFVKFVGESQTAGDVGKIEEGPIGKAYMDLTVGQRSIISLAGPLANFLLAIILFAILALTVGEPLQRITIADFSDGPAEASGLEVGDTILAINDTPVRNFTDIRRTVSLSTGDPLRFLVERNGVEVTNIVTPIRQAIDNGVGQQVCIGTIGALMSPQPAGRITYAPHEALLEGGRQTAEAVSLTGRMIGRMVTGREPLNQLSGPVGVGDITRRAVSSTLEVENVPFSAKLRAIGLIFLQISAFVSVGIGLFNLLPFPVLDGGHLVFNAYEAVSGSVLPAKIQELALTFGALVLLSVAVLVTASDILKTGIVQTAGC